MGCRTFTSRWSPPTWARATDRFTGCSGNGQNGVFQVAAHTAIGLPACTDTTLSNGATFISDTGGAAPVTNFGAWDITAVLQCILPVGASGCGFEHQLASVVRALGADGAPAPPENAGFLRSDASLAIVLLTNEDDCSAPVTSELFADDAQHATLTSPLGPPDNYRCNEYGHLCGSPAVPPPRLSPNPGDLTTTVALDGLPVQREQPVPPVGRVARRADQVAQDGIRRARSSSPRSSLRPRPTRFAGPILRAATPDRGRASSTSCDAGTVERFCPIRASACAVDARVRKQRPRVLRLRGRLQSGADGDRDADRARRLPRARTPARQAWVGQGTAPGTAVAAPEAPAAGASSAVAPATLGVSRCSRCSR